MLNPVRINGVTGSNPQLIGKKLNEIADNARTHGIPEPVGSLYGFTLLVKTETSNRDGFDLVQNRFFARGGGEVLYRYNNGILANDPKTASMNLLHALERQIQLSLKPIEQSEGRSDDEPENVPATAAAKSHEAKPQFVSPEEEKNIAMQQIRDLCTGKLKPQDIVHKEFREVKETMGDRLVIASPAKGIKI